MGLFGFGKKKNKEEPQIVSSVPESFSVTVPISPQTLERVNLAKEEVHKVCLTKKPLMNLKSKVGLVLDYSGSMDWLYRNGTVQSVVESVIPIALEFDDNGSVDVWLFDNGFHKLPDVSLSNLEGYVARETRKYHMGGTSYAPVMKDVVSFYSRNNAEKLPSYVIFITDGDNFDDDKPKTDKVIKEAAKLPIFWQYVGLGPSGFSYLEALDDMSGRYVDNADFFAVEKAEDITYEKLLNEYPEWIVNPKVQDMLK